MERQYNYDMGFTINGVAIPNPSSFTGAASDLDTLGKRSATGELHRNKVTTKYHTKLEWSNIQWEMIRYIGSLLDQGDRFRFTYIDAIKGQQTIVAYCGDREWQAARCSDMESRNWIGTLKVSIIEI